MAFIVEDETGLDDANAYITLVEARAYWDDRGFIHAGFDDAVTQIAIIKATDYIENRFRAQFKGTREFEDQALSFPRLDLFDEDGRLVLGLPDRLKFATTEYTQRALLAELAPDPVVDDTGLQVTRKKEKIGPIEEETQYSDVGGISIFQPYPAADRLLQEYLAASGGKVSRA